MFGAELILAGAAGTALMNPFINKWKKLKLGCNVLHILGSLSAFAFSFSLLLGNIYLTTATILLLGFFMLPTIGLLTELAVEVSYPVGEGMSVGILVAAGQLVSTVLPLVITLICQVYNALYASLIIAGILTVGALMTFCMTEDYKRSRLDGHAPEIQETAAKASDYPLQRHNSEEQFISTPS